MSFEHKRKKRFALVGAAGYIAPRHMKAIKEVGGELVAALDKSDSVGIVDSYFPECQFFNEYELFDCFLDELRSQGSGVNYISIATPNYLHYPHIAMALKHGANAICEKPLVLRESDVVGLESLERDTGCQVYSILQLRHHETLVELKEKVIRELEGQPNKNYRINMNYVTSRGNWYSSSWKSEEKKSGGILANIGIHFFDMLLWIFGDAIDYSVRLMDESRVAGTLQLRHATVDWYLSTDANSLPDSVKSTGGRTYRSITVDGSEIEFSDGFTELHTTSYKHILDNSGFGLADASPSIKLVEEIRELGVIEGSEAEQSYLHMAL